MCNVYAIPGEFIVCNVYALPGSFTMCNFTVSSVYAFYGDILRVMCALLVVIHDMNICGDIVFLE